MSRFFWKRVSSGTRDGAAALPTKQRRVRCAHRAGRRLICEPLEPRHLLDAGPLLITEFMAANKGVLADEDGAYSDWIEIHNPTDAPVSLDGWYLTDDSAALTKWQFPSVSIDAGGYLTVFASDKNRTDPAGTLHTNFKLNSDGEYLALVQPDGLTISHEYAPAFPALGDNVSFGLPGIAERVSYHVPTSEDAGLGTGWTATGYNDFAWDRDVAVVGPHHRDGHRHAGVHRDSESLGHGRRHVGLEGRDEADLQHRYQQYRHHPDVLAVGDVSGANQLLARRGGYLEI